MYRTGVERAASETAVRIRRRRFLQIVTGVLVIPVLSGNVRAQDYPTRPITIVVPGAPASPIDTLARFIVERTRASLGQPIIIENIVGAGGSIGAGRVAHAAPDGYTLVIGTWGTHVVNGAVYALSYDVKARRIEVAGVGTPKSRCRAESSDASTSV